MNKYLKPTHYKGLLLTVILSIAGLLLFFNEQTLSPNTTYFSISGYGAESYYGSEYHVKYDTSYFRTNCMNYPYGELVLYTGNQPFITNSIKFFSVNFFDISNYTVGIINSLLLYSILFGAVFLYLILRFFNFPYYLASIAGVAIAFLSPQIERFDTYFYISYVHVIPLMLYLLIRFYDSPSYLLSLFIAIASYIALSVHFYLFTFHLFLLIFFWIYFSTQKKDKFGGRYVFLSHFFLQVAVPLVINQLFYYFLDSTIDRSVYAFGYLFYRCYPATVFLPLEMPYGKWLLSFVNTTYPSESVNYLGIVGIIGIVLGFTQFISRLFKRIPGKIMSLTDSKLLNLFLWTSLVMFIFSFGFPFIFGLDFLLNYIPFLNKIRSISQFSWLFYYAINISFLYIVWRWRIGAKSKLVILYIGLALLCIEGGIHAFYLGKQMNYKRVNQVFTNKQKTDLSNTKYQSIVPLPYFNIGSENFWKFPKCEVDKKTMDLSLATGIPTHGVVLHSVSVSQSFKQWQMFLEPYRIPLLFNDLKSVKPFLFLIMNCDFNSADSEFAMAKWIKGNCTKIFENSDYQLYEVPLGKLYDYYLKAGNYLSEEVNRLKLNRFGNSYTIVNEKNFIYKDFYGMLSNHAYMGVDAIEFFANEYSSLFNNFLPNASIDSSYIVSVWMGNINKDLNARTVLELELSDSLNVVYHSQYRTANELIRVLDNDWALLEIPFKVKHPKSRLKIKVINSYMRSDEKLYFDELLIRPKANDVYIKLLDFTGKNNRYFPIE